MAKDSYLERDREDPSDDEDMTNLEQLGRRGEDVFEDDQFLA